MSAAVPRGQCVNIATDGYGGQGTVRAPHGYDSKTSHMGVDGIGTGRGKTLHNQVVGKMLVARNAGMVVKLVSYVGVCHFFGWVIHFSLIASMALPPMDCIRLL